MATLVLAVVCCGIYPLVVFGIGQVLLPRPGQRQPHRRTPAARSHGSRLIGQQFTADKYFHPRPSAAGNGYDPTSSGGSNLGPTSQKLARHHRPKHRRLPHPKRSGNQRPRARRRRHRLRQRPRPAHQPAQRRTAGAPRRQSPRPDSKKSANSSSKTPTPPASASSANPA